MNRALQLFAVVVFAGVSLFVVDGYSFATTGRVVSAWDVDGAVQNLPAVQQEFNLNLENVPNFIKTLFGNERLNLTIARLDGGTVQVGLVTRNGRIESVGKDVIDDYTMDVQVAESTVDAIASSDDQAARLKLALDTGEITYQARTFKASVKVGVSRLLLSVAGWFI